MRRLPETRTRISRSRMQYGLPFRYDGPMTIPRSIVILGSGYTGRWIYRSALKQSLAILASSRRPDRHLSEVDPSRRVLFDLAEPSTWAALPPDADVIWTFPATPLEQVQAFAQHYCRPPGRLVVLGSTSAYDREGAPLDGLPAWIDEAQLINTSLPRVRGEEYLRTHHGAIILRVAGIYGPDRNPVEWIRQGRVGPSNKFVNLIHVEDLAHLCLLALQRGQAGDTYNVSDGHPRRWVDICDEVSGRWGVSSTRQADRNETGKRIRNYKILTQLGYTLQHPDFYEALRSIEADRQPPSDAEVSNARRSGS